MSAFINEIFAPALTIAERLKPLRGCMDWEQAAGHYGAIKEPFLMLRDCLKEIGDSLDHVPNALHEPIKAIARIAKGTETECVSIGDVCIYLANADLEGPALQGWKAILAEKPDAKDLYPWASNGGSEASSESGEQLNKEFKLPDKWNPDDRAAETTTEAAHELSASAKVVLHDQATDRGSADLANDHSLSIETWSDLAIGIEADGSFYAFSPAPATNAPIRLRDGIKLDLSGTRWPKVLDCFARSSDGATASKATLITELGYMLAGVVSKDQADFSTDLKTDAKRALPKLTGAMADLGRQLRKFVKCPESQVFESGGDVYRSNFVVRHLVRDEGRQIRFGRPREFC